MDAGRFTLVREVGTGTWGTVYLAQDARGMPLAVKVLHPAWERNREAERGLRADVERLKGLEHPHVAAVYGVAAIEGRTTLAREFVEGVDLGATIKALRREEATFPVRAALELAEAVASALDAAASLPGGPVLHGDLSPANILVSPDGGVKVVDFGIARDAFDEAEAFTQSVRYGSMRYRAPERRLGKASDAATDVYALGCVLHELLSGRPFGNAEREQPKHEARVEHAARGLEDARGDLPPGLLDLIRDMLDFHPNARPTAAAVGTRARKLAIGAPGEALFATLRRWVPGERTEERSSERPTEPPGSIPLAGTLRGSAPTSPGAPVRGMHGEAPTAPPGASVPYRDAPPPVTSVAPGSAWRADHMALGLAILATGIALGVWIS